MNNRLPSLVAFLTDLERLKLVERKAYVSDMSRRENSAEHSWHLAVGLLTLAHELNLDIDLHKALVMALVHDFCEIDAGDTPIYGPDRPDRYAAELQCIQRLESYGFSFGWSLEQLWREYEDQVTVESHWVKVLDRLTPFIVNIAINGKNWKEQSISRSQLLNINEPIRQHAPELYDWVVKKIDECVALGWLRDV
jgi:putative hydrolases of HD superfamily